MNSTIVLAILYAIELCLLQPVFADQSGQMEQSYIREPTFWKLESIKDTIFSYP